MLVENQVFFRHIVIDLSIRSTQRLNMSKITMIFDISAQRVEAIDASA